MNEVTEAEAVRSSMIYLNKLVINSREWMKKERERESARQRKKKILKYSTGACKARELMKL
jgi:hypothetical protein